MKAWDRGSIVLGGVCRYATAALLIHRLGALSAKKRATVRAP